jgi:hypothetical protein
MYWERAPDVSSSFIAQTMSRAEYRSIKQNLHLCDNASIDQSDNMFKVRAYMNMLNKNFQKFDIFEKFLSVDEQMVP